MFKTEREKYYRDRLEMAKRQRLESGYGQVYTVPASVIRSVRRSYRRQNRLNTTGRTSTSWNKKQRQRHQASCIRSTLWIKTAIKAVLNQEAE